MSSEFKTRIYELVSVIPEGRVMYYSQLALLAGKPRAARAVGMIAHFGDNHLPWHRVVAKSGNLASGYWGGKREHASALKAEGVKVKNYKIKIEDYLWQVQK